MRIVDLEQQPHEEWRVGVMTRMKASATDSATQLCMFEQWCEPGHGAPTHLYAIEEVLCVRDGPAAGMAFQTTEKPSCTSSRHSPRRCSRRSMTTSESPRHWLPGQ